MKLALKYSSLPLFSRQNSSVETVATGKKSHTLRHGSQVSIPIERTPSRSTSMYSGHSLVKESQTTSNWKFHHNKTLPKLYREEPIDFQISSSVPKIWCMDNIIDISAKNDQVNIAIKKSQSSSTLSQSSSASDSNRRHHKSIFGWLRIGGKHHSIFDEKKNQLTFLDKNDSQWSNARVCIYEGRIFIFKLKEKTNKGISNAIEKGDLNDLESFKNLSSSYYVYNLFESVADLVQDNVVTNCNRSRTSLTAKGNFNVTFPAALNGKKNVLEFQTPTIQEANDYVACINFWAARLSPIPYAQFEIVSNEEYGWGDRLLNKTSSVNNNVRLSSWKPLLSLDLLHDDLDSFTGNLDFETQLAQLKDFVDHLEDLIDRHNNIKPKLVAKWNDTRYFEKVMDNWNEKYLYMNYQYDKRIKYLRALQAVKTIVDQ